MPLWQRQEVQAVPRRIGESRSQCDEFAQQGTSAALCPFQTPCLPVTKMTRTADAYLFRFK